MTDSHASKTSGQLAREVQAERNRVEATIGAIQQRLSPGQLVDEVLSYAKHGAGGEFVANLGRSVSTNPFPVALMGISLVWLMARQGASVVASAATTNDVGVPQSSHTEYRYATIRGDLRLAGRPASGEKHIHLVDDSGVTYRAKTDTAGRRAGDFTDAAGNSFRGFVDEAGQRIENVRDQSGSLVDEASNWLSDTWYAATESAKAAAEPLTKGKEAVQRKAGDAVDAVSVQARQTAATLLGVFQDQPLVGGALAFAVGAAIAASVPHTDKEDEVFGEAADSLKAKIGDVAGEAYEQAREHVVETYDKATGVIGGASQQLKASGAEA